MKPINVKLDEITEADLNLARSDRALSFVNEIVKLPLADRTQRLNNLQRKIQEGKANLFEEKVLARLLENQTAEKIEAIRQNLPYIEAELKKRQASQSSPVKQVAPPASAPAKRTVCADNYPSELLEFLASQKPPTPPLRKLSEKQKSRGIASSTVEKQPASYTTKNIGVGISFVIILALALWYTVASEESPPTPATFDQQATEGASESGVSKETLHALQTQFDDALQQLRFGTFDQGKAQLLDLIQNYPKTFQAEDAYLAIADTYRQRQNNPEEALKYYQTFTEKYPQSPRLGLVQLKMGFAYEDLEDTSSAAEMYHLILNRYNEKSRLGQLANERLNALKTPKQH